MVLWWSPTASVTQPTYLSPVTTSANTTTIWWTNSAAQTATTAYSPYNQGTNQTGTSTYNQMQLIPPQQMTAAQAAYHHGLQQQYLQAAHAQHYERYQMGLYRPLESLWQPAAPAMITHQDQARRDLELYRRALAEHDEQEAQRLLRLIEAREDTAAERQRLIEQQTQQHREEIERRAMATQRAKELLFEHLTPQQRESFERNGWFVIEGGRSKTRYRIRNSGAAGNIDVLDRQGRITHRLCGHAPSHIPLGDQWLAQKMMLEFDEDAFLRIANRHGA